MSSSRLTETSYIVLGLIAQMGSATPYDLKRVAQLSTVNFWSVPHTQLYTECARLAEAGLLTERREESGRRRRIYRLAERGRRALESWRSEPTGELEQVRDPATLKLFLGGDPATLAAAQLEAHRDQLKAYEELQANAADSPPGWRLALEAGIGHEREFIRFWSHIRSNGDDDNGPLEV
ncbi:MAG: PadR family transcriptional regulator [Solirubrobacterales bacterium]